MKPFSQHGPGSSKNSLPACLFFGLLITLASASSAQAHPGHSFHEASMQHLLLSPYHLAVLALGGLALWCAGLFFQRHVVRRALQQTGILVAFAAAIVWGISSSL